jgi:PAS domain S-box-containing protein
MKNIASPKVLVGLVIAGLILMANILVADRSVTKISENNQLELLSENFLGSLAGMLLILKDAEIAQREYISTGNPQALQSHQIQVAQLRDLLGSLPTLRSNRPQEKQRLALFKNAVNRNLRELSIEIDKRRIPLLPGMPPLELSPQERQIIPDIRQEIVYLDRIERANIDRNRADSRSKINHAKIALAISGGLDVLLLFLLYSLVTWDRAKQNQIESTLRDYAAEFEELYHNAPCGYHSLDESGQIERINRTELQMLGYDEAELVGHKKFTDLLTPASARVFQDRFSLLKTRGWVRDLEFQIVCKNGRVLPVSATVQAIYDRHGNYLTSRSTLIDISDRTRLRQQAQLSAEITQKIRSAQQLEEILQATVEGVQHLLGVDRVLVFRLAADEVGTVVAEQVLPDYPVVLGNNIIDPCFNLSYHDRYERGRVSSVADITQAGFKPCYVEFLQQFSVRASVTVPIHLRAELWGLLIVHQCQATRQWQPNEITLLSQLANQIGIAIAQVQSLEQEQQQRQELMRSNAELEQFAYISSHDLQEPLRMVTSYLQLLERRYQGKLDADADEFIGYAVDGAARMQALIQALLGYARVSSRGQPFAVVDCNKVFADAISNLHVAITETNATVTSDSLPEIWGDATQLTQLFQNLIANAIKFRRDLPPRIQISVHQVERVVPTQTDLRPLIDLNAPSTSPSWQFEIADNGIGIEAQYLDRIFVIFQRLHSRTTYPGTGIGLAICKKIIERHGGQIWVESTPDRGSVFSFIIHDVGSNLHQNANKQPPH